MGFFGNLFNAVLDIASGIADGVGELVTGGGLSAALDCVAEGFSEAIDEFREKVDTKREEDSEAFEDSQKENAEEVRKQSEENAESFARDIGEEVIDVDEASAEELREITNKLNEMQEQFDEQAEKIESDIISYVRTTIHETISGFEEINKKKFGGSALNLNISYLKSFESDIESQIRGSIKNAVKKNLSLDNDRCKEIFNQEGKEAKKKAMDAFQIDIYRQAVEEIWTTVRDSISLQNQSVFVQIEDRLAAIEANVDENLSQLRKIEHMKHLGEEELEKKQIELHNMIEISTWCMKQLNNN